jgi:hypothetical protein
MRWNMGILRRKEKIEDVLTSRKPSNEEVAIAKKVVFDHVAVKNAVRTLRDFGKEFGINMLDPKGLEQAAPLIRKRDEEDRVNQRIEEKIAPLNKKIDQLIELMQVQYAIQEKRQQQTPADDVPNFDRDAPDYVKDRLINNKKPMQ